MSFFTWNPGQLVLAVLLSVPGTSCTEPDVPRPAIVVGSLLSDASWTGSSGLVGAADRYGYSVSDAGDVNCDGLADVIVGAPNGAPNYSRGAAFVYHGNVDGLPDMADWSVFADEPNAALGWSVSAAGDVDADGCGDVIIGALGSRSASVYRGSPGGLELEPSWSVASADEDFGTWVSSAGDVNCDGFADVVVGSPEHCQGGVCGGQALVYHGTPLGLEDDPAWTAMGQEDAARFGATVSGAGDVDGDGCDDLIVGADSAEAPFVYLGSAAGLSVEPAWSRNRPGKVSAAGDVNGDGFDDVVVVGADQARVYHGSADGLSIAVDWTADPDAHSGSAAGDVNGDGYGDVVFGTSGIWDGVSEDVEAQVVVFYGGSEGLGNEPAWTTGPHSMYDAFGRAVSSAGDVNGDGYDDLIIGSDPAHDGHAYLYEGTCDEGAPCQGGLCRNAECDALHCLIDGVWYLDGERRSVGSCEVCSVAVNRLSWSPSAEGSECPDGLCHEGLCDEASCYIDGAWFPDGANDPAEDCFMCRVAEQRSAWSVSEDRATCHHDDAGPSDPDAGGEPDASPGSGDADSAGGCSCRAGGSGPPRRWLWFALVALAAVARRRRAGGTLRCPWSIPRSSGTAAARIGSSATGSWVAGAVATSFDALVAVRPCTGNRSNAPAGIVIGAINDRSPDARTTELAVPDNERHGLAATAVAGRHEALAAERNGDAAVWLAGLDGAEISGARILTPCD